MIASRRTVWALVAAALLRAGPGAAEPAPPVLAAELAIEGDPHAAAVEFRRLALEQASPERAAGYFWAAAYAYAQAGDLDAAARLLDRAEDANPALRREALLLRAQLAAERGDYPEAEFELTALLAEPAAAPLRELSLRRLAGVRLRDGRVPAARAALVDVAAPERVLASLDTYARGPRRSPTVGGLLGLVPGLGYAYSGEYANGLRSLLLNALFIAAMVETADEEQWALFAAAGFFEVTFYTGSIYGGVDSAHRFNRERLDDALDAIGATAPFAPDWKSLPVVTLQFRF